MSEIAILEEVKIELSNREFLNVMLKLRKFQSSLSKKKSNVQLLTESMKTLTDSDNLEDIINKIDDLNNAIKVDEENIKNIYDEYKFTDEYIESRLTSNKEELSSNDKSNESIYTYRKAADDRKFARELNQVANNINQINELADNINKSNEQISQIVNKMDKVINTANDLTNSKYNNVKFALIVLAWYIISITLCVLSKVSAWQFAKELNPEFLQCDVVKVVNNVVVIKQEECFKHTELINYIRIGHSGICFAFNLLEILLYPMIITMAINGKTKTLWLITTIFLNLNVITTLASAIWFSVESSSYVSSRTYMYLLGTNWAYFTFQFVVSCCILPALIIKYKL